MADMQTVHTTKCRLCGKGFTTDAFDCVPNIGDSPEQQAARLIARTEPIAQRLAFHLQTKHSTEYAQATQQPGKLFGGFIVLSFFPETTDPGIAAYFEVGRTVAHEMTRRPNTIPTDETLTEVAAKLKGREPAEILTVLQNIRNAITGQIPAQPEAPKPQIVTPG